MSWRRTAPRLAVVALLTQCFSLLVIADNPAVVLGDPPPKRELGDPSGPQSSRPDLPEAATLSKPTSNDVLLLVDRGGDPEKVISKREEPTSAAVGGMWFGPRIGRKLSDVPPGNSAVSGLWFGPRMGRDAGSDKNDFSAASGLWFGPRMGRAAGGGTDDRELASGMWFGPRMGRSVTDGHNSMVEDDQYRVKDNGMWLGRRMERWNNVDSYASDWDHPKNDNVLLVFRRRLSKDREAHDYRDVTEQGKWIGPRMGRVSVPKHFDDRLVILKERAADREPAIGGLWFGPRMGKKRQVNWEAIAKKAREQTAGLWFAPP